MNGWLKFDPLPLLWISNFCLSKMASDEEYEIPENGAVFTFGKSGFAENQPSHFFIRNDPVVEISCGDEHTAVICKNGRVFLFGHNDYGQLGMGHTRVIRKPSCLKYLKPFHATHVACGKGHTIVSTECGRLFSFGCNSDGQLGLGDINNKLIPQLIETSNFNRAQIVAVSAGCFHSACLTDAGELFLWGNNADGQCGIEAETSVLVPTKLKFENSIDAVSCGYYHTAFISDGDLYTFGEADNGKLGAKKEKASAIPEKVEIKVKCIQVTCGGNHTLILSDEGKAFAFGSNFSGQLGTGSNNSESYSPTSVNFSEDKKIIHMSAGENHSAFITETGELYTCGDARHGKVCAEDESVKFTSPTLVTFFTNFFCSFVCCGGCHTMVLAKLRTDSFITDTTVIQNRISALPPLKVKKTLNESENILDFDTQTTNHDNETKITQSPVTNLAENSIKVPQEEALLNLKNIDSLDDLEELQIAEGSPIRTQPVTFIPNVSPRPTVIHECCESDSIVQPKSRIKQLINIIKRKKSSDATIVAEDISQKNEGADNVKTKHVTGKTGNQNRSMTCTIL